MALCHVYRNVYRNTAVTLSRTCLGTHYACGKYWENTLLTLSQNNDNFMVKRHAGHAKWQNTKGVKAKKGSERSRNTEMIFKKIRWAVREGAGYNPKVNTKLAKAMQEGKSLNIALTTMEKLLKRMQAAPTGTKQVVEAAGPGGALMMVECIAPKWNTAKNAVVSAARKTNVTVRNGVAAFAFTPRGVVTLPANEEYTLDRCEEIAIEAGAEEVQPATNEEGDDVWQLVCPESDLFTVKKSIESMGHKVGGFSVIYEPQQLVELGDADMQVMREFEDRLQSVEVVEKIFDNIQHRDEDSEE